MPRYVTGLCILALVVVSPVAGQGAVTGADLETIRSRMTDHHRGLHAEELRVAGAMRSTLSADGTWSDIDYTDRNRAGWELLAHLDRVRLLARALDAATETADGAAWEEAVHRGLGHWLAHDHQNPNWWYNRIGVPRALYPTLLLLGDLLTEAERERGLAILARSGLGMTGQNRVWLADCTLARACLAGDGGLAAEAVASIRSVATLGGKEGVQHDGSFFQHGQCLYSGGYGKVFAVDQARLAALVHGTSLEFGSAEIETLSGYVLDGQQWMMWGDLFDYGTVGREISRRGRDGRDIAGACDHLASLGTPRRTEFEAFAERIRGDAASPLEGNRHFHVGEFTSHRRAGFMVSVRTCSERVLNTDQPCNEEGLLSHHIADGATFVHRDGGEYREIFGAWDWRHVPGTTVALAPWAKNPCRDGRGPFAGGVSDGWNGVVAFHLDSGQVRARKAWFCFDDEIVCLGADIDAIGEHRVVTTLDQSHLRGAVRCSPAFESRGADHASGDWVHHAGIGYALLDPGTLRLRTDPRPSDWNRINRRYPVGGEELPVFDLWIDHGEQPSAARYAYVLLPDVAPAEMPTRVAGLRSRVLGNSGALQAVWHAPSCTFGVVFATAGALDFAAGEVPGLDVAGSLRLDGDGLLLVRVTDDGLAVASASPTAEATTRNLELSVDGREARIELVHPGGPRSGATVRASAHW